MEYLLLLVGFLLLIKGADWFVDGASSIATSLKVPSIVIGLTLVSLGTSAPEAAVSITAGLSGNSDIALGNVIGSNIFNVLLILGLAAAISPVAMNMENLIDAAILIAVSVIVWLFAHSKEKIVRSEGIAMLGMYAICMVYICIR